MSRATGQLATTQIRESIGFGTRSAEILEIVPIKQSAIPPRYPFKVRHTPSTGRFPPTPNPSAAYSPQVPTQLGPPPTARPNRPARNSVVLNAKRRPTRSDPIPQNEAPTHSPVNKAQVVYRTLLELTPNSDVRLGKVSATVLPLSQFRVSRLFWRS